MHRDSWLVLVDTYYLGWDVQFKFPQIVVVLTLYRDHAKSFTAVPTVTTSKTCRYHLNCSPPHPPHWHFSLPLRYRYITLFDFAPDLSKEDRLPDRVISESHNTNLSCRLRSRSNSLDKLVIGSSQPSDFWGAQRAVLLAEGSEQMTAVRRVSFHLMRMSAELRSHLKSERSERWSTRVMIAD